jgi:hypothetical protein
MIITIDRTETIKEQVSKLPLNADTLEWLMALVAEFSLRLDRAPATSRVASR